MIRNFIPSPFCFPSWSAVNGYQALRLEPTHQTEIAIAVLGCLQRVVTVVVSLLLLWFWLWWWLLGLARRLHAEMLDIVLQTSAC